MYHCEICNVNCPSDYQWEEHLAGWKHAVKNSQRKQDSESAELKASGKIPLCKCNRFSVLKKTFKDGPNCGRSFFACEDSTCKFFQWADTEVGTSLLPSNINNNNNSQSDTRQTFLLTRPTCNEKSSNSRFPQDLHEKFSGVNIFFKYDPSASKLSLSFNYNEELISIIKEHCKGREWNSASKCWLIPEKSIPDALALFEFVGIYVPKHIQQLSGRVTTKYGGSASSSITLTIVGKDVHVGFQYDPAVIAVIKQLHPKKRMFVPDSKIWIVASNVLVQFVASLVESFQVTVPSSLQTFLQGIQEQLSLEEAKERIKSSLESMKQAMSRAPEKHLVLLKEEVKNMDAVPATTPTEQALAEFRSQQLHEISLLLQQKLEGQHQPMAIDPPSKSNNSNNSNSFQKRKRDMVDVVDDCDCGKPWKTVDGVHVCRYYGTFQCEKCGHRWTSGYTWKNETQACRECNTENFPIKKQPLEKLESSNIDGPHDVMRCGMCRALGRPCHGRGSRISSSDMDWY